MIETASREPSKTAIELRQQFLASTQRPPLLVYALIALASLVLGVGGTLTASRSGNVPALLRSAFGASGPQGANPAMAGLRDESVGTASTEEYQQRDGVYISPARQQLIGVRTEAVTYRALEATIRTVGVLAYDETRMAEIHTKIAGWVERVYVDFVGKPVRRGQPLFSVYSPDLVSTQKEYLLALKAQAQLGDSKFAETRDGATALLAATRERLKLWDITDAQIGELARTGEARKSLTLYSPFHGVVLERNTFAGQYVAPGMAAFKIADLSTIWAIGQIVEYELARVKLGQRATVEVPHGQTSRTLTGKVAFISPDIDPQTRRAQIRIEFPNPGSAFKPGSYVTVSLNVGGDHQLAVPKEAVIDTGAKRYAIVARGAGSFQPREIEVGQPVDDYFPVIKGLQEGQSVVTSAQFLIDSETNLQAAMQAMSMRMPGMDVIGTSGPQPAADHSKHKQ